MDVGRSAAMLRLGMFGLVVVAIVLLVTNPSHEAHKQTVYTSMATEATNSEMLGKIAVDVLGKTDVVPLQYNNYFVFSTTTLNGETRSIGILSRVWKWK
jgi:hypothetical protein